LRPLKREVTGNIGTVLGVVLGALSLVFLLVCANVANLVLVRAQARPQEFAIRAALGAGWVWIANAVYEREEAIAITGFSLSTLVRAEKSGGLKGRHKGGRRYYLGSDLLKWLQEEHYGLSKVDRRQRSR